MVLQQVLRHSMAQERVHSTVPAQVRNMAQVPVHNKARVQVRNKVQARVRSTAQEPVHSKICELHALLSNVRAVRRHIRGFSRGQTSHHHRIRDCGH